MGQLNFDTILTPPAAAVAVPDCAEVEKSQAIRVLDVAVIGPGMVIAGLLGGGPLPWALRAGLVGFGASTVLFNAKNYAATRAAQE